MLAPWERYDFRAWEEPRLDIGIRTGTQITYPLGTYLYEELGITSITTMAYEVESGYMLIGALSDSFAKAGGTVVSSNGCPLAW